MSELPEEFVVNEEVELGVVIGKKGKKISKDTAMDYVGGYCLALDMTETRLMNESRTKGLPWALGKGFDTSCPVSRFITKEELPDPSNVRLWCKVNGETCQDSSTCDLLFTIQDLISFCSCYMTLLPGDLVLTGTPDGVKQVKPGDIIDAGIGEILQMKFPVIKC